MCRLSASMRKLPVMATFIAGLVACGGNSSSTTTVQLPERCDSPQRKPITALACTAMQEMDLRSAIIQVSVDGKLAYSGALGESAPGIPATSDMHFRNGAIAMTYMSTVLLQLVDENSLSLDDKVGNWLPGLPASDQVTLEMLMNNTSGYPDYVVDAQFLAESEADPLRAWTAAELLAHAFSKELVYTPGSNWNYSHTNYLVLGAIIERTAGLPLATVISERILAPLNLSNTASSVMPGIPAPVLRAYTSERGRYEESTDWNPSWTLPAGAVMTTDIADLRASADGIMRGQLLSPRSRAAQSDARLVGFGDPSRCLPGICRKNTDLAHYGLGLLISGPWLMQSALFGGYSASIGMLPERGISIAVAATQRPGANPSQNGSEALMFAISRQMAPDSPVPLSGGAQ